MKQMVTEKKAGQGIQRFLGFVHHELNQVETEMRKLYSYTKDTFRENK